MKKKDLSKNNFKKSSKKDLNFINKNIAKKSSKKDMNKLDKVNKDLKKKFNENNDKKGKSLKKADVTYLKTGISGFDSLFDKGKGIPSGASVLVEGGPGSGKTIFCLTTLANLCKKGKRGLYMSFEEPESELIHHMEDFGWPARDYIKKGLLRIKRFDAIDVSRSIEALLSAAKKELLIDVDPVFFPEDFKPDFIVIDSLTSIASAFSGEESRFRIYMEQLFRYLEKNNITNFLIREVSAPSHIGSTYKEQGEAVSFLSDGIIIIYNVAYDSGKRESAMELLKMRGVGFKKRLVKFEIRSKGGFKVYNNKVLKRSKKDNFQLT
ncbi:MAG: RAD55 family ATPase [Nanoarchaeota archaeon]